MRVAWFVGIAHFVASTLLLGINWDQVGRRLTRDTILILVGYALVSFVILLLSAWLSRKARLGAQIVVVALVPYLSASIAYVGGLAVSGRMGAMIHNVGILPVFFVAAYFPYLVIWGPIISAANVGALLLGRKVALGVGRSAS